MAKLTASEDISDFLATADDAEARASLGIFGSPLTLISDASGGTAGFALLAIPDNWKNGQGTLTGLQIGSSVTSIGDYAFNYCSGFTGALTIPSSVTSIGSSAFNGCSGFTSANINVAKTIIDAATNCFRSSGISTIHTRASDGTWTAGAGQTIGEKSGITVIKDL